MAPDDGAREILAGQEVGVEDGDQLALGGGEPGVERASRLQNQSEESQSSYQHTSRPFWLEVRLPRGLRAGRQPGSVLQVRSGRQFS